MSAAAQKLVELAVEKFPDLTEAEAKLLRHAAAGDPADYRGPTAAENDPNHAETWGELRTVRAQVIRWLGVDRDASKHVDPQEIRIDAAKIVDQLNLASITIPFPLVFTRCAIYGGVNLKFAETRLLSFQGSAVGYPLGDALQANEANVTASVLLGQGFRTEGIVSLISTRIVVSEGEVQEVELVDAAIAGDLTGEGGAFHKPGKIALLADGIRVQGPVFLCDGFQAGGKVSLIGATITDLLDCGEGTFHNPGEIAIDISGGQVGGGVFLRWGFRAEGEVRLIRTTIGGDLDCGGRPTATGDLDRRGTIFCNPIRDAQHRHKDDMSAALNADGLHTGGGVFLRWDFRAEGRVSLIGATIAGDLDCGRGTFHNPADIALNMDRVRVGGAVVMREFRAEGMLSLEDASAGQLADEQDSWPAPGKLRLRGFVYTTIADNPRDANARRAWKARCAWLERQPATSFSPQPYRQLAKVLRETGYEAAAKRILIAQEKAWRKRGKLGWWDWGKSLLLGATIAHGYRPSQALVWAAIWAMLGGFLFGVGYKKEIVIPAKAEAYEPDKKTWQETAFYPDFNPWLYSLDTFVPIINFGQKDYWGLQVHCSRSGVIRGGGIRLCILGILNKPTIRALYLYRWLHIFVGWALITLIVAGFTGLVRKE